MGGEPVPVPKTPTIARTRTGGSAPHVRACALPPEWLITARDRELPQHVPLFTVRLPDARCLGIRDDRVAVRPPDLIWGRASHDVSATARENLHLLAGRGKQLFPLLIDRNSKNHDVRAEEMSESSSGGPLRRIKHCMGSKTTTGPPGDGGPLWVSRLLRCESCSAGE